MTANYPTKCWYVAATCDELGDAPLGRRLLGRDIVLWRSPDRQAVAFDDRCAHRGFPLSDGHVEGDRLVCGYHGCTYVADGRCVHVPTQPDVPTGMSVQDVPDIGGAALRLDLARAPCGRRRIVDHRELRG